MKHRADFISRIQQTLLQKKAEVDSQLAKQSHEKLTDGVVQDSADEVQSLFMENLQSSLQRNEIGDLQLMEDALARITKGEYGICIDCSEPISEKRLEHFPYAARCIKCQEAFEQ